MDIELELLQKQSEVTDLLISNMQSLLSAMEDLTQRVIDLEAKKEGSF